jgi:hypothetical protein
VLNGSLPSCGLTEGCSVLFCSPFKWYGKRIAAGRLRTLNKLCSDQNDPDCTFHSQLSSWLGVDITIRWARYYLTSLYLLSFRALRVSYSPLHNGEYRSLPGTHSFSRVPCHNAWLLVYSRFFSSFFFGVYLAKAFETTGGTYGRNTSTDIQTKDSFNSKTGYDGVHWTWRFHRRVSTPPGFFAAFTAHYLQNLQCSSNSGWESDACSSWYVII